MFKIVFFIFSMVLLYISAMLYQYNDGNLDSIVESYPHVGEVLERAKPTYDSIGNIGTTFIERAIPVYDVSVEIITFTINDTIDAYVEFMASYDVQEVTPVDLDTFPIEAEIKSEIFEQELNETFTTVEDAN